MENSIFKNSIFFILLIGGLIFCLYIFNFNNLLLKLSSKEHLVNLYKPNKVFYHDNKIYLIDTHQLIDDTNPKIFNNFSEFQKYIMELEEKHLVKLPLKKNNIVNGINNIKDIQYDKDLSIGKKELLHFEPSKNCFKKESICNFSNEMEIKRNYDKKTKDRKRYIFEETDLYKDKKNIPIPSDISSQYNEKEILKQLSKVDNDKLRNYQAGNCNTKVFDDSNCNQINEMIENGDELNEKCFVKNEKSDICKKFNKNRWNLDLLNNFCLKSEGNYSFDKCLEGEYFKENLLDFEL